MERFKYYKSYFLIFSIGSLFCYALTLPIQASGSTTDTFYLITNTENEENFSIKRRTLRAIYSMRTQSWPNGERLTVFVLPDDAKLHEDFCQQVLGLLPYQLRKNWDRLIFSGKAGSPISVASIEEMKAMVAKTPGGIGYVTTNLVDDSVAVVEIR